MKKEILNMKKIIIFIFIAVFSFWGLNNLKIIGEFLSTIFSVLLPFILGSIIAFILNIPMKKIELFLKKKIKNKDGLIRGLSIVLSLLLFVVIILIICLLIIPKLVGNINMLISSIPALIDKIKEFAINLLGKYPDMQIQIEELFSETGSITSVVSDILSYFINSAMGFVSSIVSGFITVFTALIFSIYMLSQKEYLIRGTKKIIYAIANRKLAETIIKIGNMTNTTFNKFLTGQCLETIILGCLMFVALNIFKIPYALLISVLTAITALIPIFGAFIAAGIGFILILLTNPFQAIIFIIVFLVVQQIEGNFIYPKVVGKSVGLSPMWTLLAVTTGGKLFGIIGMLIGLPIASIIYTIFKDAVNIKLEEKKILIS